MCENKVLRKISGSIKNEVNWQFRILHEEHIGHLVLFG